MTHALVLGGGGPVGIAWELGVLAGLADTGLDLAGADRIVGTSAGAVVGAQIAAGRAARDLYADHLDLTHRAGADSDIRRVPTPNLSRLVGLFMRRRPGDLSSPALLREMGAYAMEVATVSEADFVAGIGRLVVTAKDWPARFACTAVEAMTGAFQVWDAGSGVDLVRAVASSCAVPGLYPPVTVGSLRYIDGGMRSAINTDVAGAVDVVLVLAVTVRPAADLLAGHARIELDRLAAHGTRTALIVPDAACLDAFGADLMDGSRHAAVAAAGREQGRREAGRLGAWP